MELTDKIVEKQNFYGFLIFSEFLNVEVTEDNLALLGQDVDASFIRVDYHSLNFVIAVVRHELFYCHFNLS
jgi:hypothetical protein